MLEAIPLWVQSCDGANSRLALPGNHIGNMPDFVDMYGTPLRAARIPRETLVAAPQQLPEGSDVIIPLLARLWSEPGGPRIQEEGLSNLGTKEASSEPEGCLMDADGGLLNRLIIHKPDSRDYLFNGITQRLFPMEYAVLACLTERPGMVVRQETIAYDVWGTMSASFKPLHNVIAQLRKRLTSSGLTPAKSILVTNYSTDRGYKKYMNGYSFNSEAKLD